MICAGIATAFLLVDSEFEIIFYGCLIVLYSSGQEKRSFSPEGSSSWPIFRWSHDDKYFARMGNDMLSIYQTPSFGLVDKKSIKIPGIRDFSWSPTDNVIAYWVAEHKDVPAKVTLMEIPNRNEIRNKNLFNVADCKIHWQKSGDYLCVKVDRYSKVKRHIFYLLPYHSMFLCRCVRRRTKLSIRVCIAPLRYSTCVRSRSRWTVLS